MTERAVRIVDAMNAIHGVHPGHRSVHAKGLCCKGTFVAFPEAASYCTAPHLQGQELAATVRFSNGSGKPTRADGAKDERGMAVKFHLADGPTTDLVCLTIPTFFVKDPETFLEFLETQRADPETGKPDLDRVATFVDAHPETQRAIGFVMMTLAPASYANCTFYSIHAFKMTASDGNERWVRYRWIPSAGEATLRDDETRALGRDYLRDELIKRLESSTFDYELQIQIGEEGDDPNDPTEPWPEERQIVRIGRLTITEFTDQECAPMIFDPGRLIDGIERSDDPILHARSEAYSVSFERRTKDASA